MYAISFCFGALPGPKQILILVRCLFLELVLSSELFARETKAILAITTVYEGCLFETNS